jgi:hypothetical protein
MLTYVFNLIGWPVGAETCCDTERYNNINTISQLRLRVYVRKILTFCCITWRSAEQSSGIHVLTSAGRTGLTREWRWQTSTTLLNADVSWRDRGCTQNLLPFPIVESSAAIAAVSTFTSALIGPGIPWPDGKYCLYVQQLYYFQNGVDVFEIVLLTETARLKLQKILYNF